MELTTTPLLCMTIFYLLFIWLDHRQMYKKVRILESTLSQGTKLVDEATDQLKVAIEKEEARLRKLAELGEW